MKKEKNRNRSKSIAILESLSNQAYKTISRSSRREVFSNTEVGLLHEGNNSKLHFYDDGNIILKDRFNNGLFINKEKQALLLNSKHVHLNGSTVNVHSRPDGFRINGYYLNPEVLHYGQVSALKDGVTTTIPLFIAAPIDNEIEELLKEFQVL